MTRHDDSQRIDRLAVTQRGSREVFAITRAAGYSSPRMGTHALHPSRQLAVPQQGLGRRLR